MRIAESVKISAVLCVLMMMTSPLVALNASTPDGEVLKASISLASDIGVKSELTQTALSVDTNMQRKVELNPAASLPFGSSGPLSLDEDAVSGAPVPGETTGFAETLGSIHHIDEVKAMNYTGSGVNIGIVDTGVDFSHIDLEDSYLTVEDPDSPYYGWPVVYDAMSLPKYLSKNDTAGTWFANTSISGPGPFELTRKIEVDGAEDFSPRELVGSDTANQDTSSNGGQKYNFDLTDLYMTYDSENWYFGYSVYDKKPLLSSAFVRPYNEVETLLLIDVDNETGGTTQMPLDYRVNTISTHADTPTGVAYNADGTLLATASLDKTIKIWDTSDRSVFRTLVGHVNPVQSIAWSDDGTLLASGDTTEVRIWEVSTGKLLHAIPLQSGNEIQDMLDFNNDGTLLAICDGSHIMLFDLVQGEIVSYIEVSGDNDSTLTNGVDFSNDGAYIAAADNTNRVVKIWALDDLYNWSYRATYPYSKKIAGDDKDTTGDTLNALQAADGTGTGPLVMDTLDGWYSVESGKNMKTFTFDILSPEPNADILFANLTVKYSVNDGDGDGSIGSDSSPVNVASLLKPTDVSTGIIPRVGDLDVNVTVDLVSLGLDTWDDYMKLWVSYLNDDTDGNDTVNFDYIRLDIVYISPFKTPVTVTDAHGGHLTSVEYHPTDPNMILTSSLDGKARIFNCEIGNGTLIRDFAYNAVPANFPMTWATWNSDGTLVATSEKPKSTMTEPKNVRIWNADGGLLENISQYYPALTVDFDNGDDIVIAGGNNTVYSKTVGADGWTPYVAHKIDYVLHRRFTKVYDSKTESYTPYLTNATVYEWNETLGDWDVYQLHDYGGIHSGMSYGDRYYTELAVPRSLFGDPLELYSALVTVSPTLRTTGEELKPAGTAATDLLHLNIVPVVPHSETLYVDVAGEALTVEDSDAPGWQMMAKLDHPWKHVAGSLKLYYDGVQTYSFTLKSNGYLYMNGYPGPGTAVTADYTFVQINISQVNGKGVTSTPGAQVFNLDAAGLVNELHADTLILYRNGVPLAKNIDYTFDEATQIITLSAASGPLEQGESITADYTYGQYLINWTSGDVTYHSDMLPGWRVYADYNHVGASHAMDSVPGDPLIFDLDHDGNEEGTMSYGIDFSDVETTVSKFGRTIRRYFEVNLTSGASMSDEYKFGYHPSESLGLLYGGLGILVVDSTTAGVYDTVIVDFNGDKIFDDLDPRFDKENPLVRYDCFNHSADIIGDLEHKYTPDGYPDISGGILYFISDGVTPIPYSEAYWNRNNIEDRYIPANGEVICFGGELSGESHGTQVASLIASKGTLEDRPVEGIAPGAKLISVCNAGDDLVGSWYFIVEGYDGIPGTGDEADIAITATSIPSYYEDGWDRYSRSAELISTSYSGGNTLFIMPAGEDAGEGYGSVSSPASGTGVLTVGMVTDNIRDSVTYGGEEAPFEHYGDVSSISGKGPTPVGKPKPDLVAGSMGYVLKPLSTVDGYNDYIVPPWDSNDVSAAIVTGIAALTYEAYNESHYSGDGVVHPDGAEGKALLMSNADDLGYDVLRQGAGLVNALASVNAAREEEGVVITPSFLVPGEFDNLYFESFADIIYPGQSDTIPLTIMNTGASDAQFEVADKVLKRTGAVEVNASTYTFNFYTDELDLNLPPSGIAKYEVIEDGVMFLLDENGLYKPFWNETIFYYENFGIMETFDGTTNKFDLDSTASGFMLPGLIDPEHTFVRIENITLYLVDGGVYEKLSDDLWSYDQATSTVSVNMLPIDLSGKQVRGFYNATIRRLNHMLPGEDDRFIAYPEKELVRTFDSALFNNADLVRITAYYDYDDFISAEGRVRKQNSSYYLKTWDWNNTAAPYLESWGALDYIYENLSVSFPTFNNNGLKNESSGENFLDASSMTVTTANANVVSTIIHHPAERIHDGLAVTLLPFDDGGVHNLPVKFMVEFFEKDDQPWISVEGNNLGTTVDVTAGNGVVLDVMFDIPEDAPVGGYEAQIEIRDTSTGKTRVVPVFINVASNKAMFTFGGSCNASSDLYDSHLVGPGFSKSITGTNTVATTITGDWRFFMVNMPNEGVFSSTEGIKFMIELDWDTKPSDLDVMVMTKANGKDLASTTDVERFGHYNLELGDGSEETGDFFTTTNKSKEIIAVDVGEGLNVIGIKATGLAGDKPYETIRGEVYYTQMSTELYEPTNHYSDSASVSFMTSRKFDEGLNAAAIGPAITERNESETVAQDYQAWWNFPNWGEWLREASWKRTMRLEQVLIFDVHIWGHDNAPDLDLGVFTDVNEDGELQLSEVLDSNCIRAGGTLWDYDADWDADEHVKWLNPPDGQYIIVVLGFDTTDQVPHPVTGEMVAGGTFDIEISQTLDTGEGYKIDGVDDEGMLISTVENGLEANQPIDVPMRWNFPGTTSDGAYGGGVLLGTKEAPKIMLIPANIRFDITAPTFEGFSLTPGETINSGDVDLRFYFADESGEMAGTPARVYLDGEDVTPFCSFSGDNVLYSATGLSQGGHEVVATLYDAAGNERTATYNFAVDTVAPVLAIENGVETILNSNTTIIRGITDGVSVTINRVPVTVAADGSFSYEVVLEEGVNNFIIESQDAVGNLISSTKSYILDTQAPEFDRVRFEGINTYTNQPFEVITGLVDVENEAGDAGILLNGDYYPVHADGSFSVPVTLYEGENVFTIQPVDQAGNLGGTSTLIRVLDTVAPSVTVESTIFLEDVISYTYTGTVDDPTCDVTVNGQRVVVGADGSFQVNLLVHPGVSQVKVLATDDAGNTDEAITTLTVSGTVEPAGTSAPVEPVVGKLTSGEGWMLVITLFLIGLVVGLIVGFVFVKGKGGGPGDEDIDEYGEETLEEVPPIEGDTPESPGPAEEDAPAPPPEDTVGLSEPQGDTPPPPE